MKAFSEEKIEILNEMFGRLSEKEKSLNFELAFQNKYGYFPDESDYRIKQQIEDFKKEYEELD